MNIDILQHSLAILALVLWVTALTVAMTGGKRTRSKVRGMVYSVFAPNRNTDTSVIDKSMQPDVQAESVADPAHIDIDTKELQKLRALASEEKILFSEASLVSIIQKADALGGPSGELLSSLMESAKAAYPRVDGYINIDTERLSTIL